MKLLTLAGTFAVVRLDPSASVPEFALQSSFFSITKSLGELSIVCEEGLVPDDLKAEKGWRILKVDGVLDFNLTGILASIANPLAEAKISIFAVSTYDTDYILIKAEILSHALNVLSAHGFEL
jgi:hypothetical protein